MAMNDSGVKPEKAAAVIKANSDSSPPAAADEPGSSITVNTKTTFPPPKTDKPRPHVCATCSRSFARLEHLKRHERSHTKEKPFECPECTRCFARRDLLLRHQQKLHQSTAPSSRPRNRRESTSSVVAANRVRKNSVVGNGPPTSMRPRANTISHVDPAAMQMIAAANANMAARNMAAAHSRHASLIGLPMHHNFEAYGMAAALGQRGITHGLPKLDTNGLHGLDFSSGLRTAPPMGFGQEFDFESLVFSGGAGGGSTINPNALHLSDSPQSMAMDPISPFPHLNDMVQSANPEEGFDWLTGFDNQMSFRENAVGGSSPSAISTTSQISDVMVDGSNHAPAAGVSMWANPMMRQTQMHNPFAMDLNGPIFPDLLSGAPVSPAPGAQKVPGDGFFSTPPPTSLSGLSPSVMQSMGGATLNQALGFGGGPETPSSLNGGSHGVSPVSTITDATRNAIVGALSQCSPFGGRKYSFATPSSPLSPQFQSAPSTSSDIAKILPGTQDLRRYVDAYLRYFHPHLPFLHIPTLSFEIPPPAGPGKTSAVRGGICLVVSMAAIGALYELEHAQSKELFEMAKRLLQLYLEERRKADMRKVDVTRNPGEQGSQGSENGAHSPVWLVQAMLLNVVYGHNCGDKTASEVASTHCSALVSLAQAAELTRPARVEPSDKPDTRMADDMIWNGSVVDAEEQAEWLRWKAAEERKRTLYIVFILSSLLVCAYNHPPAITNSEILLDLPCDEEFYSAESAAAFQKLGGIAGANRNRMTLHEALAELLRANEKQKKLQLALGGGAHQPFGSTVNVNDIPKTDLKPSTFGCLILINALHNYIWETRQRHQKKVWTNDETEKMHRHIEPALKAWQAAWASNPTHSLERPNPFRKGPLSADAIPLLDLAYVRLFVNLSRSKERFWQRDWEGMAEELSRGDEIVQHAEQSPESNSESAGTDPSEGSMTGSGFIESPATQPSSSPDFSATKFPAPPPAPVQSSQVSGGRSISRREKHLRKAAFYAADSLAMADKLGVTFAEFTSRELPLQSAMCAFDCAQVLAEWAATLQDRVGRYLGVLGRDEMDLGAVPAIMLLEEEDVKLLSKVQEVLSSAEMKLGLEMAVDGRSPMEEGTGYASKLLRVTAFMLEKAAVWPVTRLMAQCLETHANYMRIRAEKSLSARD